MGYDYFRGPIRQKHKRYNLEFTYYVDCECRSIARKQWNKNIYLCPICGKSYKIKNNKYVRTTHYVGLK